MASHPHAKNTILIRAGPSITVFLCGVHVLFLFIFLSVMLESGRPFARAFRWQAAMLANYPFLSAREFVKKKEIGFSASRSSCFPMTSHPAPNLHYLGVAPSPIAPLATNNRVPPPPPRCSDLASCRPPSPPAALPRLLPHATDHRTADSLNLGWELRTANCPSSETLP